MFSDRDDLVPFRPRASLPLPSGLSDFPNPTLICDYSRRLDSLEDLFLRRAPFYLVTRGLLSFSSAINEVSLRTMIQPTIMARSHLDLEVIATATSGRLRKVGPTSRRHRPHRVPALGYLSIWTSPAAAGGRFGQKAESRSSTFATGKGGVRWLLFSADGRLFLRGNTYANRVGREKRCQSR